MYSLTTQQHPSSIKQGKNPILVLLKAGSWDRSLTIPGLQATGLLWGGIEQEVAAAGVKCD